MKKFLWALALTGTLATVTVGLSQTKSLAIRNVRIFDGTKVIARGTVVVTDGKISAVGANVSIPRGAEIVDGEGKTLLPGLIDGHVHMSDTSLTRGAMPLEQATIYGITTVLEMGVGNPDDYPGVQEASESWRISGWR